MKHSDQHLWVPRYVLNALAISFRVNETQHEVHVHSQVGKGPLRLSIEAVEDLDDQHSEAVQATCVGRRPGYGRVALDISPRPAYAEGHLKIGSGYPYYLTALIRFLRTTSLKILLLEVRDDGDVRS